MNNMFMELSKYDVKKLKCIHKRCHYDKQGKTPAKWRYIGDQPLDLYIFDLALDGEVNLCGNHKNTVYSELTRPADTENQQKNTNNLQINQNRVTVNNYHIHNHYHNATSSTNGANASSIPSPSTSRSNETMEMRTLQSLSQLSLDGPTTTNQHSTSNITNQRSITTNRNTHRPSNSTTSISTTSNSTTVNYTTTNYTTTNYTTANYTIPSLHLAVPLEVPRPMSHVRKQLGSRSTNTFTHRPSNPYDADDSRYIGVIEQVKRLGTELPSDDDDDVRYIDAGKMKREDLKLAFN